MHRRGRKKNWLVQTPCSPRGYAPKKRRLYLCMLIGHAYQPSTFMVILC